jgi:hypothetical protein
MSRLFKGCGALAATTFVAALFAQGAWAVVTLKADYQFHDSHSSFVPGAPDLVDLGSGNGFATEQVGGCSTRVLTFPQGNGLQADTSSFVSNALETIVLDFRLADVSSYRRLIAGVTGPSTDTGLYVHGGRLDWFETGAPDNEGAPLLADNAYAEVALTQFIPMSGMYQLVGFVNGVQQFSYHSQFKVIAQPSLFKDNAPPHEGEESTGAVFRVRFYADGLTPAEVGAIYADSVLSNPAACPAASAKVTGKPRATKNSYGVYVDAGVLASCPDTGVECSGTVSVKGSGAKKSKKATLGSTTFTLGSGKSLAATVKLGKRGRKLLASRGKLKVMASVAVTGPNGKPVSAQTAGKIKAPRG